MLRTRSFAAIFAAAAIILTTPGAVLAQDEAAASPDAGTMSVPFEGVFVGTVNFAPVDPPTDACPMVRTIVDATGHTTIGTVTVHAEHCPTMAPGIPSAPGGTMTMTTESGDQLESSYWVDCDPVVPSAPEGEIIACVGRLHITGGTGIYAGATGTASQVSSVWFGGDLTATDWPWLNVIEGELTY